MLLHTIAVTDEFTMNRQKGVLLQGLTTPQSWNQETTLEILSRLDTIRDAEDAYRGFCVSKERLLVEYREKCRLEWKSAKKNSSDRLHIEQKMKLIEKAKALLPRLFITPEEVIELTAIVEETVLALPDVSHPYWREKQKEVVA